jgi:hypothetical protein
MNKFTLPKPPVFALDTPPLPPMESSKSFLFTFDYLFETLKNSNKCPSFVNYKHVDNNENKINYVLVVLSVFLIIFFIVFIILILNCFIKFNFIKIFKKLLSKILKKFGKNEKVRIVDSKTFIISSNDNQNSITSNIYEKVDITANMVKEKEDDYNCLLRTSGKVDSVPNLYYSILTMHQQGINNNSNIYYSINI